MNPSQPGEGLDLPGKIASYRIEKRLGAGGMGVVYRAFDEALQRPLAIKHLLPGQVNPTASRRFRREAQAAARLNHPAIVHIYDIFETETGDWIVMELVEGKSLVQVIRDGSLDLPQAVRLGREIAEGLAEAHAQGVIHRDLKASNVMVTASGRAKILDFGLAKLVDQTGEADLSQPGIILGTCHAMSPEQVQGLPLDHRSDLFSLGSLLYEMLTGVSPFRGETAIETLTRVCNIQPPPVSRIRPEVPQDLSDLVVWLLGKNPDQRPASAREVVRCLRALETAVSSPGGAAKNARPAARSGRGLARGEDLGQKSTVVERPVAKPSSGRRSTSERRQVTVLCCELVGTEGSSGSPQAFDPEALHELMLRLRATAEEVSSRYDGHLGSILGGPRMLIYFGYPQAHEDNARRAVRAALELVDEVARMRIDSGQRRPLSLALRAGVHTGLAVVAVPPQDQEPMTLGTTLDLAVELQSLAEPGCVMVSPATCSLIEKSFALESLSPVQVPGLAEPLIPYRVLEPMELQEHSSASPLPLVGREPEMELLLSRWNLAREGNGQAVVISGEAGIGKSRLVRALRERLELETATWWSCFASPFTRSTPLQPFVGLLRQFLLRGEGASPLKRLASSLRDLGLVEAVPLLAPLLDLPLDDRHPAPPLSPERQREKTLEALVDLMAEIAERQPLVLLVEDLHWLDPTSLSLLDHLIDQAPSAPLLLLLTLRPQTLETLWGPRAHLTQITLAPLSDAEAKRLIDGVVGEQSLPDAVRQKIVVRTDGIPLFLEELTRAVLESDESGERQELPATLRDSLTARLDRLGTAKAVAQIASVIGRVFSFELLAAVWSSDEAVLQQELRHLIQAELVHRKGFGAKARYVFKHALVQDAAYESLLKRERQQIHRQIAETLEARFPETAETQPEILAHHYTEADLTEPAIDFWERAGRLASRRSANAEALSHLDRALRLLQTLAESPERDRTELKIQNAWAAAIVSTRYYLDPEFERTCARAADLAERLADADEHFWAVYGLRTHHVFFGNLPKALPLAERLLEIAGREGRPDFLSVAWYGLGTCYFWRCEYAKAAAALERACELAPPDDDSHRIRFGPDLRVASLSYAAMSLGHHGQLDRAKQKAEQAIARARQLGSPFTLELACAFGQAVLAHNMRDVETIRHVVPEVYDLAVEMGLAYWVCVTSLLLAWSELQAPRDADSPPKVELGDVDSMQRLIARMAGSSMGWFFCIHAEIRMLQGRPGDAWRVLDEGLRRAEERGVPFYREEIYRLQGEILLAVPSPGELLEGGGPAEAERLFLKALEEARCKGARLQELHAAASLGRFWKSRGRTREARELVARACEGFTGDCAALREARAFLEACPAGEK